MKKRFEHYTEIDCVLTWLVAVSGCLGFWLIVLSYVINAYKN